MAGTYQLDGETFPKNPISKRWTRQQVASSGAAEGIYSAFWQVELTFDILKTDGELSFFEGKWLGGGLHSAVLPHPQTGALTGFTGVNIALFNYDFNDVDGDEWAERGARLVLDHINLAATGTV